MPRPTWLNSPRMFALWPGLFMKSVFIFDTLVPIAWLFQPMFSRSRSAHAGGRDGGQTFAPHGGTW